LNFKGVSGSDGGKAATPAWFMDASLIRKTRMLCCLGYAHNNLKLANWFPNSSATLLWFYCNTHSFGEWIKFYGGRSIRHREIIQCNCVRKRPGYFLYREVITERDVKMSVFLLLGLRLR
jgi:hypothetical protein